MNDFTKVKCVQYTGTIESYNQLVDHIFNKESGYHHIWFVDDKNNIAAKFTGLVHDALTGVLYKPGDCYYVEIKDE